MRSWPVGIHSALWVDRWGEDLRPHLRTAAGLGFDHVEVSLLGLDDPDVARGLRDEAADLGIDLVCTTGLGPATDVTSADPAVRAAGIDALRGAADVVAALGARLLTGVLASPWGVGTSADRSGRWDRSTAALAEVAPAFADRGITLGIEAVNRFEADLVTTAAEAVAYCEAVDQPNVGVHLDTFHMHIEERSPAAAVRTAGDRLVHVHVVDNDRGAPGRGQVDVGALLVALEDVGYEGRLGLELFVRPGAPVSADLRIWRAIADDATAAAEDGLAHVRGLFRGDRPPAAAGG